MADRSSMARNRFAMALWLLAAALLYLAGAWQHLHLGRILDPTLLFGDDGDGFFNLWVLLHNTLYLPQGPASWMDGRIFWPDNGQTLFWSDILLAPTLPFAGFRAMGAPLFTSFNLTIILLSVATYTTLLLLLHRFRQWSSAGGGHLRPDWLILLFAFTMAFSISQLTTYIHFQNLCGFAVLLVLLGLCGFSCDGRRRWLALALAAEVSLLYTVPYFAVLGSILFGIWLLLHCLVFSERIRHDISISWWLWPVAALAALPPTLLYHRVEHLSYSPAMLHATLASHIDHLWIPSRGPLRQWLLSGGQSLPRVSHESLAYLGVGVLLLLPATLVLVIRRQVQGKTGTPPAKQFLLPAGLFVLYQALVVPLPALAYWLAWASLLSFLVLLVLHGCNRVRVKGSGFPALLLLFSSLAAFGLALGPNPHFLDARLNPSLWGIFKVVVPGVANMRAIGRMAGPAAFFLLAWIYLQYAVPAGAGQGRKRWLLLLPVLLLTLQNMEAWPVQARVNHYPARRIQPTATELGALRALPPGIGCVFPTRPWPRNTHAMLYLAGVEHLTLVNGYSARSTRLLDRLMAAGRDGREPTPEQLAILERVGCDYLLLWKRKIDRRSLRVLRQRYPQVLSTGEMIVLRLAAADGGKNGEAITSRKK